MTDEFFHLTVTQTQDGIAITNAWFPEKELTPEQEQRYYREAALRPCQVYTAEAGVEFRSIGADGYCPRCGTHWITALLHPPQ